MKVVRRILIALATAVVVLVALFDFILPAGLSFYLKRTAPAYVRTVPRDLQELSVSQASGTRMCYFGYEFEVPWSDVREADRKPFAAKASGSDSAWVSFQSGLKLFITAYSADEASSDYAFAKTIYEFSPDTMHIWPPSPRVEYQRLALFIGKSTILSSPLSAQAAGGIFNLYSKDYKGFQLGNPQRRPDTLTIRLYSDGGSFQITFLQAGYEEPSGVTQPEINRIVQSLHRATAAEIASTGK